MDPGLSPSQGHGLRAWAQAVGAMSLHRGSDTGDPETRLAPTTPQTYRGGSAGQAAGLHRTLRPGANRAPPPGPEPRKLRTPRARSGPQTPRRKQPWRRVPHYSRGSGATEVRHAPMHRTGRRRKKTTSPRILRRGSLLTGRASSRRRICREGRSLTGPAAL